MYLLVFNYDMKGYIIVCDFSLTKKRQVLDVDFKYINRFILIGVNVDDGP